MTPEVVIYRYLEILQHDPVDVAALTRIICTDADLLGRWLGVLQVPADPDLLRQRLGELAPAQLRILARAEALAMMLNFNATRLALEHWEAELRGAFLAEALARETAPVPPSSLAVTTQRTAAASASRIRSLVLLATSGISLAHDTRLRELIDLRGASPEHLQDADPVHQILAVVDAAEDRAAALAEALLGVSGERFRVLREAVDETCQRLLKVIGIQDEAGTPWGERIAQDERVATLSQIFSEPGGEPVGLPANGAFFERQQLAARALFVREPCLLLRDADGLFKVQPEKEIRVRPDSGSSVIAGACRDGVVTQLEDHSQAAVADRLVLRRLGADEALVVPLVVAGTQPVDALGALVFPLDEDSEPESLMRSYAQMLARALRQPAGQARSEAASRVEHYRQREAARLREIVHEANNPLSIVNNYLHILELRLQDDAALKEQLSTMSRELRRAAAIFQQVKDLPDVDDPAVEGRVDPASLPVDLGALLRRTVELHRGYADAHGVELEANLLPVNVSVLTDENLLAQVLTNLLRNAIEACRSGDLVTVSVVTDVYRNGARGIEIDVHDSGPGIEPAVLEHLFEPKASTKGPEHSGLGLSIAYRVVTALGGNVDVRTSAATGTSFRVFLPQPAV